MDIAKMREDLEAYCCTRSCEGCPLDGNCNTGHYWDQESDQDAIEMWKKVFPNEPIPLTEEEKGEAAEIISLKAQITQQEKAYATLVDQFNKLQAEKNNLQEIIADRTKDVQHYDEENKMLTEKLAAAEKAVEREEKENQFFREYANKADTKNRRISEALGRFIAEIAEI